MVSTRKKGNILQNYVAKFYQERGFSVHNQKSVAKQIRPGLWISQRNDILGFADLLCTNRQEIRFIQVTGHTDLKAKLDKITAVAIPYDKCIVEIWQYISGGRWKILRFDGRELKEYAEIQRKKFMLITTRIDKGDRWNDKTDIV